MGQARLGHSLQAGDDTRMIFRGCLDISRDNWKSVVGVNHWECNDASGVFLGLQPAPYLFGLISGRRITCRRENIHRPPLKTFRLHLLPKKRVFSVAMNSIMLDLGT